MGILVIRISVTVPLVELMVENRCDVCFSYHYIKPVVF